MGRAPNYLKELIPPSYNEINTSARLDRSNRHFNTFYFVNPPRLQKFKNSFIPHAVRTWNHLPLHARTANTLGQFKSIIQPKNNPLPTPNTTRHLSITYTRLKYGLSSLNSHLKSAHLIDNELCSCRTGPESTLHYFFDCPFYDTERRELFDELDELPLPSFRLPILLHPESNLPQHLIQPIHRIVCRYIASTRRFSHN